MDLETFLSDGAFGHGICRRPGVTLDSAMAATHILLVDDSLSSGASMAKAAQRVSSSYFRGKMTTCAIVTTPSSRRAVDLSFASIVTPRMFEWNAFHHPMMEDCCFDLDGVLCVDPTPEENDDGLRYREFLQGAKPLIRPTRPLGHIVSARLEKYRGLTETWLGDNGIAYKQLHLVDLPSHAERRRSNAHHTHKAGVYRRVGAPLFYESDPLQAREISRLSGLPVLCVGNMQIYMPSLLQPRSAVNFAKWKFRGVVATLPSPLRHIIRGSIAGTRRLLRRGPAS